MAKRMILHAGATKTGSSALQAGLAQNYDALLAQGFFAPKSIKFDKVVDGGVSGGNAEFLKRVGRKFDGSETKAERVAKEWLTEIATSTEAHTVVISGEAIPGSFDHSSILLLRDILLQNFEKVEVYYYVRHLADHAASQYGEYVRRRRMRDSFAAFAPHYECPFKRAIEVLEHGFGAEAVKVVLYDDVKDRLWPDFVTRIGGNPEGLTEPRTVNRSLSAEEVDFVRKLNALPLERVFIAKTLSNYTNATTAPSRRGVFVSLEAVEAIRQSQQEALHFVNQRLQPPSLLDAASPALLESARAGEPEHQPLLSTENIYKLFESAPPPDLAAQKQGKKAKKEARRKAGGEAEKAAPSPRKAANPAMLEKKARNQARAARRAAAGKQQPLPATEAATDTAAAALGEKKARKEQQAQRKAGRKLAAE